MNGSGVCKDVFGILPNGDTVEAVCLTNGNGMTVRIISYGASIQSVCVPDRDGIFADVTTGYSTLDDYILKPRFFGSTVGRVANRIAHACFSLNGKKYSVPANDGRNSLHGGMGFDKANWVITECDEVDLSVTLQHISPDGDQGYPGTLTVTATYSLDDRNALTVQYLATTDATTIVNLSNHAYWTLGGEGSAHGAMNHRLTIHSEYYLPVDAELIPTGERRSVDNSAFDFRKPTAIGTHVREASDEQIRFGRGYDHNWIIHDEVCDAPA